MKTLALLVSGIVAGTCAMAQIAITSSALIYNQDFNSLDTVNTNSANLPAGWAIKEIGSSATTVNNQYKGNSGTSTTGETYSYGAPGSTDRALGSIASTSNKSSYGAQFVNSAADSIVSFSISYTGEQWRRGSGSNPDSLAFSYSLNADSVGDAAAIWIPVTPLSLSSINTGSATGIALNGNLNTVSISYTVNAVIHPGELLTIKWSDVDVSGSDDGLAVDDFSATFTLASPPVPNFHPVIMALSPADNSNAISASTTSLQITFDKQVTIGTGNMDIKNETDQTTQTIAISSANTTISAYIATVSGLILLPGKTYHVTFDSVTFDTAGYTCTGIYDTTIWNFSTAMPPPPAATSLNENFDTSCGSATSGLPAGWMQYSVAGINQLWNCTGNGNNATPGLQMNGYANQANNANEDWLISPLLDLSTMVNPYLYFDHWKRFFSPDELQVLISHDYTGSGDPNAAVWVNLNAILPSPTDTAIWNTYKTGIAAHTSQPFYLAFKYVSSAADGYQSKLDNVLISSMPMDISDVNKGMLQFMILGHATHNEVVIGMNNTKDDIYKIEIYTINGEKIFDATRSIPAGMQKMTISDINLPNGLYIIKLQNSSALGVRKFLIE